MHARKKELKLKKTFNRLKMKDFPYRQVRHVAQMSMRGLFFVGSIHYIKYTGQRAKTSEAPVIVAAPHTSFIDALCVIICGPSSVVAKSETASMTLFGSRSIS